jgi:hypothetical protein
MCLLFSISGLEDILWLLVMINQGNAYGTGLAEAYKMHT